MNLNECYASLGGSLEEVLGRLVSQRLVVKFLRKFPEDTSFSSLRAALAGGDLDTAFRCAHNLKGLCLNLGFPNLLQSSSALTEALRPGTPYLQAQVDALMAQTALDYSKVCDTIARLEE